MMRSLPLESTINSAFTLGHPDTEDKIQAFASTSTTNFTNKFDVDLLLTFSDMKDMAIKAIKFHCLTEPQTASPVPNMSAFDVLMSSSARRSFPAAKTSSSGMKDGLNNKDVLFNKLLDMFVSRNLDFPSAVADTDGTYIIQVICNALWYITNQHSVINNASVRKKDVKPIPPTFDEAYSNCNDFRKKTRQNSQLSQSTLRSHGESLYSLLLKPVSRSSAAWSEAGNEIKELADCLVAYADHLINQATTQIHNQSQIHPVRTINEHATTEHRHKFAFGVRMAYEQLDKDVREAGCGNPVFFDETKHLEMPFQNNVERFRFFTALQLSVPVDIIKFCPGGSALTTLVVVQTQENRTEADILLEGVRLVERCRHQLKEFHTRAQRRVFKSKLANVAKVEPCVAEMIYTELCIDGKKALHPVTQHRLHLIFLGEHDLLADLRHLNTGRPSNKFDVFFEQLEKIVEQITAADERRHNIAHLSEWISLKELIKRTSEQCPPGTLIPSTTLVRLQFAPRNPYTHRALTFTSKINVQYKIQRRQLRASHQDDHYCAAQFRYLKAKACEMKGIALLLCCDDKAKIPVGEPGCAVSTGVRGKKTLAPTSTTLSSMDHDMTKASLTPSVVLKCAIPDDPEKSFVRGHVTTITNDSVFQTSSPFRHGAALVKLLAHEEASVVLKYTDGGTDQRNTLESVKCATICLFLALNLDMIILARCAPGHSWMNPAERIMSILNLALQNCALEREAGDAAAEAEFKKCNSMAATRRLAESKPNLQIREKWAEVI
ncbi:uncharacterized protein LOC117307057 [Asterias rubens]|uniref:uncharacterized protein LOC117307057 n=1 Tax=Asterias rubens TaxID=7604 RepID=UPI001454EF4F|nr:uncharacterized protein LOC117307057 [Asterias rubens]